MKELLPDSLWAELAPLIPPHPPQPKGGTRWRDDRLCLRAILYVLRAGIPWSLLPGEAFGVSGVTAWRRLRDWARAGAWPAMHARVLAHLEAIGGVDHSLAVADSASVRAALGGRTRARTRSTAANAGASGT